tara:strand:+ start:149 stop:574 length:426 start_codon:yes stop_codon:yes gene_type:complete
MFMTLPRPSSGCQNEIEGKVRKLSIATFCNEVIVFQPDAPAKGLSVKAGLEGDNISDFERVIPGGINPGDFMGIETNAMSGVMKKLISIPAVERLMDCLIHLLTRLSGSEKGLTHLHSIQDMIMSFLLFLGRRPVDGKSPT